MIGLFFGSFNPIHTGHLIIANYMANYTQLTEVWLVVSPQNPFKQKTGLADMYDRLEMAKLATEDAPQIKVSDIEFKLPLPSYTSATLAYLQEKYPTKQFALIMGADNLSSFKKWKNYETLLKNHKIFVYPRPGFELIEWKKEPTVFITETPLIELSSSFIRNAIKNNKSIRFLAPDAVIDFMEKKSLYK